MTIPFFQQPILNSPYFCPTQHWEMDDSGQPTGQKIPHRRLADFITPIPKSRKSGKTQSSLAFDEGKGLSTAQQIYQNYAKNLVL